MRCMTAIWPAGPPKLWTATRNQTRTASEKGTASRALTPVPSPGAGVLGRSGRGGRGVRASRRPSQRLIQPLEERNPVPLQLLVGPTCRQPTAQDAVDPGGLGRRKAPVPQVDLMDDRGESAQR